MLRWTPGRRVPSDLFYQCHVHQKLGWRVKVLDRDDKQPCSRTHPYVGFSGACPTPRTLSAVLAGAASMRGMGTACGEQPTRAHDGMRVCAGPLVPVEHVSPGARVTVLDDCTFRVTNLTYDGRAPNVHWVGGASDTTRAFSAGPLLGPRYTGAVKGQTVTVRLPPGQRACRAYHGAGNQRCLCLGRALGRHLPQRCAARVWPRGCHHAGQSWDKINALSLYCVSFSAIMGSVNVSRPKPRG